MRINVVEKSNKDQGECGRCHKTLPKGAPYRWIKGRYTSRQVRCMEHGCAFRRSEMTNSKLSALYSAIEAAEDVLGDVDCTVDGAADAIKSALSDMRDSAQEVADEYRESAESIRESFSESATADECDEKADEIENWLSEVESAEDGCEDFEAEEFEDAVDCPECKHEDGAKLQGEGKYECGACGHVFVTEPKNADDQTLQEFQEQCMEQAQDAIAGCSL